MRFLPAAKEMTWRELRDEVELIINNLHWGHLTMNHEKFGSEGMELARQLDENIKIFQSDDFCYDDEENYKPEHVRWLFDFFTKARSYGALTGVLHDETYENRIKKLEARLETLKADNERLRSENLLLVNELHDRQNIINSYEQGAVFKRGDNDREKG